MSGGLETKVLRPIPAPVEPKLAYPEPQGSSAELLSLISGTTFFAADRRGNLMPPGAPQVGLFHQDTRFLSKLNLLFFGQHPVVLSYSTDTANASRIEMAVRGGSVKGDGLDLPLNTVYAHREQLLDRQTLYDSIEIENFYLEPTALTIQLQYEADFMDIFQVRGLLRQKSGQHYAPIVENHQLIFVYDGLDKITRSTTIDFDPPPQEMDAHGAIWKIDINPHEKTRIATTITMAFELPGDDPAKEAERWVRVQVEDARDRSAQARDSWGDCCTRIESDNAIFNAMLQSATEDFYALRMPDAAGVAVAAGIPWFAALFGRDSLIASFETLALDPDLARGTLRVLAAYQGKSRNDERDEDPGKILHERRSGEMTATAEIPFGRNYGSVDSTPLFLMLLAEYIRWTGDFALLRELGDSVESATRWVLEYGDLDGDGLIEYCRRSPNGLFNQGWKDSGDAIRHADGSIVEPPTALIEVQGYAASALRDVAPLLLALGNQQLAKLADSQAKQLSRLIEERFWLGDRGFYALALGHDKRPASVISSNPGHLLFARVIRKERAAQISKKLMSEDLFTGWGIRTVACSESIYNPMSYHCGSVWPHDNALIGFGMAQYGLHREASQLFQGLYEAALHFRDYRLPELFCGIERKGKGEPVHYPVSCSPQAWASGTPFLMLTALLGLRPDAARAKLQIVDPHLPPFLRRLRMENLRIGATRVTVDFERSGNRTYCNVARVEGGKLAVSVAFQ